MKWRIVAALLVELVPQIVGALRDGRLQPDELEQLAAALLRVLEKLAGKP